MSADTFAIRAGALVLQVSTTASASHPAFGGGILSIAFVQTVILSFPDGPKGQLINWPHISVGTLVKN